MTDEEHTAAPAKAARFVVDRLYVIDTERHRYAPFPHEPHDVAERCNTDPAYFDLFVSTEGTPPAPAAEPTPTS